MKRDTLKMVTQTHATAVREALRGAQHPKSSTSACANLVATCVTAAWAQIAEDLSGFLEKQQE
jgi:hypothetical protein